MTFYLVAISAVILTSGGVETRDETSDTEKKRFEGTWSLISAERNGKKASAEDVRDTQFTIKDDTAIAWVKGARGTPFRFKVNPAAKPKTIDWKPTDGRPTDPGEHGIYEFTQDGLRICVADGGKPRPQEFRSADGVVLMELRRKNP